MPTSEVENTAQTENETSATSAEDARPASTADKVRQSASDAYEAARERTTALYGSARERTTELYGSARERASSALQTTRRRTTEGLDSSPIAALVGGLAIGAALAALLPRTRQEDQALGTLGARLNDGARGAARAARDAGKDKLNELGLTPEGARERFGSLASSARDALRSSANAAVGSVRKKD